MARRVGRSAAEQRRARRSAAGRAIAPMTRDALTLLNLLNGLTVLVFLVLPLAKRRAHLVTAKTRTDRLLVAAHHLVERVFRLGRLRRRLGRWSSLGNGGRGGGNQDSQCDQSQHGPLFGMDPSSQ